VYAVEVELAVGRKAMDQELYALSVKIGSKLLSKGWLSATAESCTGGWIAQMLTAVPGSSQWFDRGFITYSNAAKVEILNVSEHILLDRGAVSLETVQAMAKGAIVQSDANFAIAVTGIAGPTGGSPEKPVGLVWIAWALLDEVKAESFHFEGDREAIRRQTVLCALQGAMQILDK